VETFSKKKITKMDRIQALDISLYANHLLEEDYFPRAATAISDHNETDFFEVCRDAGIPEELHKLLYKSLTSVTDDIKMW
jgi:hypothetical protein